MENNHKKNKNKIKVDAVNIVTYSYGRIRSSKSHNIIFYFLCYLYLKENYENYY